MLTKWVTKVDRFTDALEDEMAELHTRLKIEEEEIESMKPGMIMPPEGFNEVNDTDFALAMKTGSWNSHMELRISLLDAIGEHQQRDNTAVTKREISRAFAEDPDSSFFAFSSDEDNDDLASEKNVSRPAFIKRAKIAPVHLN